MSLVYRTDIPPYGTIHNTNAVVIPSIEEKCLSEIWLSTVAKYSE
jgi:hypothetical protein